MNMNQLLESIYASNASDSSLEKTAEQAFLGAIDIAPEVTAENPFSDLSLEELVKLAKDLEAQEEEVHEQEIEEVEASEEGVEEEPAVEEPVSEEEELNKTAAAMFGGQLMAHAVVHELGLIKQAVANGICRVCKENHMDVAGSSVCSHCLGGQ